VKQNWQARPEASPPWWLWPQAVSLDGPLVAAAWYALLSSVAYGGHLSTTRLLLLFMATWLFYAGDRFIDGTALPLGAAARWPFRYRTFIYGPDPGSRILIVLTLVLLAAIAFFEGIQLRRALPPLVLGAATLVPTLLLLRASRRWHRLRPGAIKEPLVALVFTWTVLVVFRAGDDHAMGLPWLFLLFLALCLTSALHSSLHQRPADRLLGIDSLAVSAPRTAATLFLLAGILTQLGWLFDGSHSLFLQEGSAGQLIALTGFLLLVTHPVLLRSEAQTGTAIGDFIMMLVPALWLLAN
jgi:hypothetical protein